MQQVYYILMKYQMYQPQFVGFFIYLQVFPYVWIDLDNRNIDTQYFPYMKSALRYLLF